jgi:hypothetical protein
MAIYAGLFLLSAATLLFEVNLTRIFSVAQFYHFAFMIVSLALLGFGASGTFLTLFHGLKERAPARTLPWLSLGFTLTAIGSYTLTLYVPFDSFRIAHEWRQGAVLALHYVALAAPFFCSGAAVGLLLAASPESANRTYAANLSGSAAGCLLVVVAPSLVGCAGTVLVAAALGLLAALIFQQRAASFAFYVSRFAQAIFALILICTAFRTPSFLEIQLSPYKSLSYATRKWSFGAGTAFRGWTSSSPPVSAVYLGRDFAAPLSRRPNEASRWMAMIYAPSVTFHLDSQPWRLRIVC